MLNQQRKQEAERLLDQYQVLEVARSKGQLGSEFMDHQCQGNARIAPREDVPGMKLAFSLQSGVGAGDKVIPANCISWPGKV